MKTLLELYNLKSGSVISAVDLYVALEFMPD
jgi:hypothetical protein